MARPEPTGPRPAVSQHVRGQRSHRGQPTPATDPRHAAATPAEERLRRPPTERKRVEAEILAELARRAAAEEDPAKVSELIAWETCELASSDFAIVAVDAAAGKIELRVGVGTESPAIERLPFPHRRSTASATPGPPLVLRHLRDKRSANAVERLLYQAERAETAISAPMSFRDGARGALLLGWRSARALRDEQKRLAETLASYATTILDSVRAHARERRRATHLEQQVRTRTSQLEKATERANRERTTLDAIMNSMTDGVIVMDARDKVRYCNRRASELLEITPKHLIGRSAVYLRDFIARKSPSPASELALWSGAMADRCSTSSIELELALSVTRHVQCHFFVVQQEPAGQARGIVLRDVTLERELVRTKDELVATVSHELRTPLATVIGYSELLLSRDYPEEQRREFLTTIRNDGAQLASLVTDFLDLQRMQTGRYRIEPEALDVHELLAGGLSQTVQDGNHPIVTDVPDGLPAAWADGDAIQRVLNNLLSNASKYSPQGGAITLKVRHLTDGLQFSVRDQGLGIPDYALDTLFQKFSRIDSPDRTAIGGTGLGLALCRQIVEAHGGQIWALSEGLGKGSEIVFTIPTADAYGEPAST